MYQLLQDSIKDIIQSPNGDLEIYENSADCIVLNMKGLAMIARKALMMKHNENKVRLRKLEYDDDSEKISPISHQTERDELKCPNNVLNEAAG